MRAGELIEIAHEEIARVGGVIDWARTSRHELIYWSVGGRKFMTPVPRIGGGPRAPDNLRAQIRRKARSQENAGREKSVV
jgi:hypothetical protein